MESASVVHIGAESETIDLKEISEEFRTNTRWADINNEQIGRRVRLIDDN